MFGPFDLKEIVDSEFVGVELGGHQILHRLLNVLLVHEEMLH
jgi:hypothetical protein